MSVDVTRRELLKNALATNNDNRRVSDESA